MDEVDVEWVGYFNWFFCISKYMFLFIDSLYFFKVYFLSELDEYFEDLYNYVLKLLYFFVGIGVIIYINCFDLDVI